VVADCFYGDNPGFTDALGAAKVPFVLARKPRKGTWAPAEQAHTPTEAVSDLGWQGSSKPGRWRRVTRRFRDGHTQTWWAADATLSPTIPPDRHRPTRRPPRRARGGPCRPDIGAEPAVSSSWPVALRAVRAWLTPWSVLQRCWRSWSPAPPPRQLQRLLDAVATGQPLHPYFPP
jgi:hypothetical protein